MSEMERYRQGRADWDPGIGQSALPCGKDLFFNEKKNLQKKKKKKTVTKVAVSFTVSLGDTCARFLPRGVGRGKRAQTKQYYGSCLEAT